MIGKRRNRNAATYPNLACFAFDSITSEIIVFGRFEKMALDAVFSRFDPSRFAHTAAVDIGANIGNHSLYFAERFARVYAIEASPKTFALLSFNAQYSEKITPINVALGERRGKLMFAEHRNEAGRSGILDFASKMCDVLRNQPGRVYEVEVQTGDCVLSQIDAPISLIKIDVEGFEASVLKGLKATIAKHQPIILLEQLASEVKTGTSETIEILRTLGYHQFYSPESNRRGGRRVRLISRLLFGDKIELVPIEKFAPKHYPMVLCLSSR